MIAADRDRRFQIAAADEFIDRLAHLCAFAVAEPTDARRQTLKLHSIARQPPPTIQPLIVRIKFERDTLILAYVFGFPGERDPTKRTFAFAEEWANVFRHEAGNFKCV